MGILNKLLMVEVEKEEGDLNSFLRKLDAGEFKDRMNYGVAEDRRGFLLVDPVQQPGALYCGGMGSGKSIAMRFTLITHLLANSENTFYVLVDTLKGMTDYALMFDDNGKAPYPKNVAVALNDPAKLIPVIELIHQECMARKEEFSHYKAPNIYEYEKIKRQEDPSYPGLARIVLAVEEFHAVTNSEVLKYQMRVDQPGSAAYMLKELLRVGRSYGITLMAATQRATSDDFPSSLKPGITQLMAFRVNNPGDATAINLTNAADIKMEQRGRCVYEGGFIQFPYLDDKSAKALLKKYYKPLKAKMVLNQVEKYHEAFSGEGNQGLVKVKKFKGLFENLGQFKIEDVATRVLETFDFSVEPQTNAALGASLVAQRDGYKYAVMLISGRMVISKKFIESFKEGAKILGCNRVLAIHFDSSGSMNSELNSLIKEMGGYYVDAEDLTRISQVLDNKISLEREGTFDQLYNKLVLVKREEKENVKEPTLAAKKEIENDIDDEEDLFKNFDKIINEKPVAKKSLPAAASAPVSVPKVDNLGAAIEVKPEVGAEKITPAQAERPKEVISRPEVSTGGSNSLMDLRERLRNSLKNKPLD